MSIGPTILEIQHFQNLTLKIKGQGHVWGHSSKSQCGSSILSTHIPFVPCQLALPFLRYSISDHRKKKSLCLPTSDSRVRFWRVMVNGAQSRSTLRRISKAKSSIRSCIGHKYVYVYELGCRIVALKSWYPYFRSDTPETPKTTFMNETAMESPRRVHSSRPTMTRLGTRFNIRLDPDKMSHRKIPWSLEAARFVFKIVPSLWFERHLGSSATETSLSKLSKRRENIN